ADSMTIIGDVDLSAYVQRRYIVPTDEGYQRYAQTQEGISPRGVPGYGEGLVCADGHEHDERGQITEDYRKRIEMVSRRGRKEAGLIAEVVAPQTYGEGDIAVVGWGSTRGAIAEALQRLADPRLAQVHFAWVHPLNPEHLLFLKNYTHVIVVENNVDGAFADRLQFHGIVAKRRILQSDGFAFFADQLAEMISKSVKELS
ncbi:MAG: 2-oxoacid:acceptor oxidoreductase subunit alpha, partial [Thiovulaceae bacterium]|nr:2-oxoacid:acceptor oxidoreductase subunit alpha [Sulfurimonadaceae bacterium]